MGVDRSAALVFGFPVSRKFSMGIQSEKNEDGDEQLPEGLTTLSIGDMYTDEYDYFVIVFDSDYSVSEDFSECICSAPTFPLDAVKIEKLIEYHKTLTARENETESDEDKIVVGEVGWYLGVETC